MINFKNPIEKAFYDQHMRKREESYDPVVRMTTSYRGLNGYHSKLSDCIVHDVRGSFSYAYDLLRRDEPGDRQRAYDILYRVIPLQDINPSRDTYGIWSYFLEEDLEEMDKPDWNWADFNGKELLRMLLHCSDRITNDLKQRMEDCILHACRAIIKRNVGPDYTNISIMGSYVTLVTGELLNQPEIFAYGKERLRKLHQFNMSHGNFSEFNSPTYTFVALFDLSDLILEVKDPECVKMAQELCDLAWETVAVHFHTTSGQLAGPHDRAYAFLLEDGHKLSIERALDYKIRLVEDYQALLDKGIGSAFTHELHCPEKFIPYFTEKCEERIIDQTFAPGRMAYTYMNEHYTLGSLHQEIAWNQHRNILGYFGSVESPIAFNLKCLHDNWDYCSALMSTLQDKGKVVTGINFTTNQGDTHCNLDMVKNATISAEDLRIRYLFGGDVSKLSVEQTDVHSFKITDSGSGIQLRIDFPYAVFSDLPITYEITRKQDMLGLDVVLYHGPRRDLNFGAMEKAAIAAVLEISNTEISPLQSKVSEENGYLSIGFDGMTVKVPMKPDTLASCKAAIQMFRGNVPYVPEF